MRPVLLAMLFLLPVESNAAVCKGGDPCKACKDCSACWHCSPKNPKGGSCGTLRHQSAEQRTKAERKRKR